MKPQHGIPQAVVLAIGARGAQDFVNMDEQHRLAFVLDTVCPEDDAPDTYPIQPEDVPDMITRLLTVLADLKIVPLNQVLAEAAAPQVENLYRKIIFREWTIEQAEQAGLQLYMDKRTLMRTAGLIEVYVLIATGFIDALVTDPEEAFTRMGLLQVPGDVQDDIHQWLMDSKPNAGQNRWYRVDDLGRMFDKMEGFFGNTWISMMKLVDIIAQDTHPLADVQW
jgi:hypothetical protein